MFYKVFDYDFNSTVGMFVIHENSPDFTDEQDFPQLGEEVFLVYLEAQTRVRNSVGPDFFNAGFGCVVKVVEITVRDGKRFYRTDYQRRLSDNRS